MSIHERPSQTHNNFNTRFRQTLDNIFPPKVGQYEISRDAYFNSLSKVNKKSVSTIMGMIEQIYSHSYCCGGYTLIAVGSTTFPSSKREHPARNINLRVLADTDTKHFKEKSFKELNKGIQKALEQEQKDKKISFINLPSTKTENEVTDGDGKKTKDFYEDTSSPAFEIEFFEGGALPIILSVSGADKPSAKEHIKMEKRADKHFSVLLKTL